jgi:excisionase family DNA binding protein
MIASASDFGGGEESRPSAPATAFNWGKENPPMIAIAPEVVNRLMELLERAFGGEQGEVKEEPTQRLLTPEDASKIMRLNVQTVTAWCREGKLRASKIGGNEANGKGGKWLIPREEVDHYLHRQQVIHGKKKGGAK